MRDRDPYQSAIVPELAGADSASSDSVTEWVPGPGSFLELSRPMVLRISDPLPYLRMQILSSAASSINEPAEERAVERWRPLENKPKGWSLTMLFAMAADALDRDESSVPEAIRRLVTAWREESPPASSWDALCDRFFGDGEPSGPWGRRYELEALTRSGHGQPSPLRALLWLLASRASADRVEAVRNGLRDRAREALADSDLQAVARRIALLGDLGARMSREEREEAEAIVVEALSSARKASWQRAEPVLCAVETFLRAQPSLSFLKARAALAAAKRILGVGQS